MAIKELENPYKYFSFFLLKKKKKRKGCSMTSANLVKSRREIACSEAVGFNILIMMDGVKQVYAKRGTFRRIINSKPDLRICVRTCVCVCIF